MDYKDLPDSIKKRYGRGDEKLCHYGDCHVYSVAYCDCGMLKDLYSLLYNKPEEEPTPFYPKFWTQWNRQSWVHDMLSQRYLEEIDNMRIASEKWVAEHPEEAERQMQELWDALSKPLERD